jgi:IS1 family transposase
MNRLTADDRAKIVACLVEGNSLRATARITGFARMTVEKLLRDLGAACRLFQRETLVNLSCKRVQCDEIWSFVGAKDKNVPVEKAGEYGSIWTWTAIDADTKLCLSWLVGTRDAGTAYEFMSDVASRLRNRIQLTTDGNAAYLVAVDAAFGGDIDFATLTKVYGNDLGAERRYSPARIISSQAAVISGNPNPKHIATSYVERQNLTMRMHMRRFTRLTNGFSKKIEMHEHAVSLHFMHYNFVRVHQTLRVTPAMAAGVTDRLWSIADIVALLGPD